MRIDQSLALRWWCHFWLYIGSRASNGCDFFNQWNTANRLSVNARWRLRTQQSSTTRSKVVRIETRSLPTQKAQQHRQSQGYNIWTSDDHNRVILSVKKSHCKVICAVTWSPAVSSFHLLSKTGRKEAQANTLGWRPEAVYNQKIGARTSSNLHAMHTHVHLAANMLKSWTAQTFYGSASKFIHRFSLMIILDVFAPILCVFFGACSPSSFTNRTFSIQAFTG